MSNLVDLYLLILTPNSDVWSLPNLNKQYLNLTFTHSAMASDS